MPKLRCCDDARSSGSNDHTRMAETVFYQSFEFPARVGGALFDFDDSDVGGRARYRAQRRHVRHGQRSAFGVRSLAVPAVVRVGRARACKRDGSAARKLHLQGLVGT